MHDADPDHDAPASHGLDPHTCTEAYDTLAAGMGIWGATHPSAPGLAVGLSGLGTHLVGQAVCNGGAGLEPGPPPDYFGGKLGYDPAHDAPPSFEPPADSAPHIGDDGFDYTASHEDISAADTHGFDYSSITDNNSIGSSDFPTASFDSGATDVEDFSSAASDSPGDSGGTAGDNA